MRSLEVPTKDKITTPKHQFLGWIEIACKEIPEVVDAPVDVQYHLHPERMGATLHVRHAKKHWQFAYGFILQVDPRNGPDFVAHHMMRVCDEIKKHEARCCITAVQKQLIEARHRGATEVSLGIDAFMALHEWAMKHGVCAYSLSAELPRMNQMLFYDMDVRPDHTLCTWDVVTNAPPEEAFKKAGERKPDPEITPDPTPHEVGDWYKTHMIDRLEDPWLTGPE